MNPLGDMLMRYHWGLGIGDIKGIYTLMSNTQRQSLHTCNLIEPDDTSKEQANDPD
jgi:hypothetical protein